MVTAGLAATGGGVEDIKVALALSGPEAMRLFQMGGEAARSFKSAGNLPVQRNNRSVISRPIAEGLRQFDHS